jgi:RNA polymerase sigma-70 factor, ECF subfamily
MRAGTSYTQHDHRADPVSVSGIQALIDGPSPDVGTTDVGTTEEAGTWGSPHAVAQLVRQHSRYVWCLLRRLGVEVLHLDDATQQVFIVAARRLDCLRAGSERSFLCGTAVRVASNFRRNCGRRSLRMSEVSLDDLQSSAPSGELLLEQMRARRLLDYVLDKMTLELRTVFVLSEIEGLTAPEISTIIGCPLGTVSSRLRRAREQFREETTLIRETLSAKEASR